MSNLKYKLIAFDIDGTLLDDKKRLLPSSFNSIMAFQKLGVKVVLASGRPTFGCKNLVEQLKMAEYGGYVISYNGGKITSCESGMILGRRTISLDYLPKLYEMVKEAGLEMITYTRGEMISEREDSTFVKTQRAINCGMPMRLVPSLLEGVKKEPFTYTITGEVEEIKLFEKELESVFGDVLSFHILYDNLLEVLPKGVNKGSSLSFLMKDLGLSREEVIAVGDSHNDLSMMEIAGVGVAMANASEAIKRSADYITKSNNEDGIFHFLNKYILNAKEIDPKLLDLDLMNEMMHNTLMGTLGIKCTKIEPGYVEATMPVDEHTQQPMGILHGGATLAMAETVAGYGSTLLLNPGEILVGMQVSGNHVHSAHVGDTVTAVGKIIHQGKSSHVWNVDVFTSLGKLVSSIRVVNSILNKR
ncbi:Cof-type HAD-IIB family hydrolase [Porphyromonadaceae bacterium W3.11]|nr:Cof-type HAD-IIB family hydrolase [Porphyromonadaceae bacterium W3.11]